MDKNQSIKFSDYKNQITDALKSKQKLGINESVSLIDGFINQPIQTELSGNFIIGGPTIPMIAVVGNTTGRIYHFALKAILPDLKI